MRARNARFKDGRPYHRDSWVCCPACKQMIAKFNSFAADGRAPSFVAHDVRISVRRARFEEPVALQQGLHPRHSLVRFFHAPARFAQVKQAPIIWKRWKSGAIHGEKKLNCTGVTPELVAAADDITFAEPVRIEYRILGEHVWTTGYNSTVCVKCERKIGLANTFKWGERSRCPSDSDM